MKTKATNPSNPAYGSVFKIENLYIPSMYRPSHRIIMLCNIRKVYAVPANAGGLIGNLLYSEYPKYPKTIT